MNSNKEEIEYRDDLPQELKDQLGPEPQLLDKSASAVLVRLLGEHGQLHRNRLIIGYYNATGSVLTKKTLTNYLHTLKKKGVICSPSRSYFELTEKGQTMFEQAANCRSR